jgi:hypothetical protein
MDFSLCAEARRHRNRFRAFAREVLARHFMEERGEFRRWA